MNPHKPLHRFLLGAGIALAVVVIGFAWIGAVVPTWGSTPQEITRALPADELVPNPTLIWNHALTIHAPAAEVYPWLVQIGDSRAAFYSISFIENAFCATSGACRYVNADRVHPEWQTPERGKQGIIMDYLMIADYGAYQPGQYVLATPSDKLPFKWTWLWYVEPAGGSASPEAATSRLIVRHRVVFPPGVPKGAVDAIFAAGFVMERAMMLGIQARAEGSIPAPVAEGLGAVIWLLVFAMGVACAVRFIRASGGYHALGVGLEAVVVLFVLTYYQPPMGWRVVLMLMVAAGVAVAFNKRQLRLLRFRTASSTSRR